MEVICDRSYPSQMPGDHIKWAPSWETVFDRIPGVWESEEKNEKIIFFNIAMY